VAATVGLVLSGGESDAFQDAVVAALDPVGGLADLLLGGQKETDQDGDNANDDQQLDQRKPTASKRLGPPAASP
jgi:hypothetical protein